jgi:hypothetical protein
MLANRYRRWMYEWETRLTTRDTNRVVRPFAWGEEWAEGWPLVNGEFAAAGADPGRFLCELNKRIVERSDEFFSYGTPGDYRLETREVPRGKQDPRLEQAIFLRFTSPVQTPYPENNVANARWFCPAAKPRRRRSGSGRRAVVVLPQWNSDQWGHNALCRIFNRLGISALRLSMPYHDVRMPAELERADYAVSANVGRTLDAGRQAVIDIRCCLDWLEQQGYSELGIVGTSLGSCYAFLASAHDQRLRVNAFNHASTYVGDVVWTGQSTRHIRAGAEAVVDHERLREAWLAISPHSYFNKFSRWPKKSLIVYAKYDLTFLPEFSRQTVEEFERWNLDYRVAVLPCGHYTTGETPFKFIDAWHLARFLAKAL